MKAAVLRAFRAPLTIEDVTLADPGPGQVAVRITACAICHSDIAYMDGAWGGTLPMVLGHEAAGIVTATGPGVGGVAPGDSVLVTLIYHCGACPSCSGGDPTSCDQAWTPPPSPLSDAAGPLTQGMKTAAFAEAVVVDRSQVVKVSPDLDPSVACLVSCGVITGVGAAVNTARIRPGQTCAVIGAGGVGLNAIQGARIAGAGLVVALDIAEGKRDAALGFGATHAFDPRDPAAVAAVRALTGGRGLDVIIVSVGVPAAIDGAHAMLATGGAVVIAGMPPSGAISTFDPTNLAALNQRILGSRMGQTAPHRDIPWLLSLHAQGRLKLEELVSNRYPFDRINDAIADTRAGKSLRNVVVFD